MSARSLNKVMLIGNLTRDPNLRFTPTGTAVCSFGLATNRSWTPPDGGEKQERAEYHNIVAWGKLADICGQLLHIGDKVYVDGRIQTRDWRTDDGQDRRVTEIVIDNMMLLKSQSGSRDYGRDQDYDGYADDYGQQNTDGNSGGAPDSDDGDVGGNGGDSRPAGSGRSRGKSKSGRTGRSAAGGSKSTGGKSSGDDRKSKSRSGGGDQDASDAEDIADDIPF
ncbi:MAG: hypothetical protein COU69_01530 [Candidatus Pacebacteria bacterium CG10_big_fil_rev_8_21_14_0_10_56_10]|nr:MAG: hypothetical protein COU69_01530 [Candidatus Pacebacteria bacterium CG10_big_fil_rev_8_21_14_0_10_56_10]